MIVFLPEFKEMLALLVKHKVNFMLIGGYAVIHYGYARTTADMDIWLRPDNENKTNLIAALAGFGIEEDDLKAIAEHDFTQTQMFFLGQKPRRMDFLTKISGVTYQEAALQVNHFPLDNIQVPVIQFEHLILSKISNGRPQDKADVEKLQEISRLRKNLAKPNP